MLESFLNVLIFNPIWNFLDSAKIRQSGKIAGTVSAANARASIALGKFN